ncbi:MAG: exo-alpha-sialidase [Clostridia bacterium]|nr:exo-alpha-sialidase [Clostridia bacterium]
MNFTLLHQIPPSVGHPRNSEGAFLRGKNGEILFAYSQYCGNSVHDHATCNIAMIVSDDEGNTWSEPRIIARASDFGVQNVMSVSAMEQKDGRIGFYFLIKENDFTTTLGRVLSEDGGSFTTERCTCDMPPAYYVINNDRLVRLSDGRIVAPAAYITAEDNQHHTAGTLRHTKYTTTLLVSEDDGRRFTKVALDLTSDDPVNEHYGFQEPGLIEYPDRLYLWMRTGYGCQYESISISGLEGFSTPRPSIFTSPVSPMQIKTIGNAQYAVYNPIPLYNGRTLLKGMGGRTPLVIRKSEDRGKSFGPLTVLEDDPERGFSYPAILETRDGGLLLAYCRGSAEDGNHLCRLGISKLDLTSME